MHTRLAVRDYVGLYAEPPAHAPPRATASATVPLFFAHLSHREEEIARLTVLGFSNKEIGQHLGISHWTVATHLRRIFTKLEITRRIELCSIVLAADRAGGEGAQP